jgi:DNA polymerase III alpha subunit
MCYHNNMITDKYGQQIFTEQDLCDLYMSDPDIKLSNVLVVEPIKFNSDLEIDGIPKLIEYTLSDQSIEEFDDKSRNNWFLPEEYKNFDIAQYVLDQCKSDAELQRAGEELLLYQERDMFILLQYLKYLVDTMRQNNIVWGVGRGSSVSSFVLYLIGIHRINSLYYDLSIDEFLK